MYVRLVLGGREMTYPVQVHINRKLGVQLRQVAKERGTSIQDLVEEAVKNFLTAQGKTVLVLDEKLTKNLQVIADIGHLTAEDYALQVLQDLSSFVEK